MSNIEQLHSEAMDLAEEAFSLQRKGNVDAAKLCFEQALILELQILANYPSIESSEPTRSILIRSATSLAFNAEDYEQAEQLVELGLGGFPPLEIKAELQALQNEIRLRQHVLKQKYRRSYTHKVVSTRPTRPQAQMPA